MKFTTMSGAVYLLRDDKVMRLTGPYSPGIDYDEVPDAQWHSVTWYSEPKVGGSVRLELASGRFRVTTPVVSIEEEE